METPATGMWGSHGDYPADFVTLDELFKKLDFGNAWIDDENDEQFAEFGERCAVRDFALDLAEDLDARGLVLVPEAQVMAGLRDIGGEIARNFTALGVPIPPDLAALIEAGPTDTADADLETGGE